jgi:hypothetical protein
MPGVFVQAIATVRERRKSVEAQQRQARKEATWRADSDRHQRYLVDTCESDGYDSAMQDCMRSLNAILGTEWRTVADINEATERQRRARLCDASIALTET